MSAYTHKDIYTSAIMLVGEYGVMAGGSALTIPFQKSNVRVRKAGDIPTGKEKEASQSQTYLKSLYKFIGDLPADTFHAVPNLDFFYQNLESVWFERNIPTGYGLGNSGAISAAIYDLFFFESRIVPLSHQKEDLATIESCFHRLPKDLSQLAKNNSGVEVLTCFTGKPLYFKDDGMIQQVEFNPVKIPSGYRLFLLDSEETFDSAPLVRQFLRQMEDPGFASSVRNEYHIINKKLIEALLGGNNADPGLLIRVLSDFQYTHFREMIPDGILDLWIEGQVTNEFYLKLSGSGDRFMLGITHQTSMESLEQRWDRNLIWIE